MFETAVGDCAKKFGLQEKIAETSRVDTDIAALGADVAACSQVALLLLSVGGGSLSCGRRGLGGLELLVGVIDKILLGRHGDGFGERLGGREGVGVDVLFESSITKTSQMCNCARLQGQTAACRVRKLYG